MAAEQESAAPWISLLYDGRKDNAITTIKISINEH